mgnify:CR=1 FL=1
MLLQYSCFEGGVKAAAFLTGGFLPEHRRGKRTSATVHIADWYATFATLAEVSPSQCGFAHQEVKRLEWIGGGGWDGLVARVFV